MKDDFTHNLSFLCSHYASIAEVCRKTQFNRQQFNKYLNGTSRPSRSSMRKICDFFGVTESEILLDQRQFESLVGIRKRPITKQDLDKPLQHLQSLYQNSQDMNHYVGYYFRYFYSFGNIGKIIKSLAVIYQEKGRYYWKNIERLYDFEEKKYNGVNKYEGLCFLLSGRIFIIEYESLFKNSITQATLYPCYTTRVQYLLGIQTGGPLKRGRRPGASKVLLEYLGKDINLREALRQCGMAYGDNPILNEKIVLLVDNNSSSSEYVLEVENL